MAAVVFVLIVLLGVGGIAIANWNQSATVAIAVTAGAAAPTSPPPTTAPPTTNPPTTAPPTAGSGIISTVFSIAPRPGKVVVDTVTCEPHASNGRFNISWPKVSPAADSYTVSIKSQTSKTAFQSTVDVRPTTNPLVSTTFDIGNQPEQFGLYLLRIQGIKSGAAGDPIYRTLNYSAKGKGACQWGASDGLPPLGAFSVDAGPQRQTANADANLNPNANRVNLGFVGAAEATEFVVSVESLSSTSSYGAEYKANAGGSTLIFPLRTIQGYEPAASAAFYGQYKVRIIPMNGQVAGDPVYKTVQYQQWSTEVWD
ncbi:hypothetical protein [Arthrobacter sp. HY1533]|uniref:hypothetical protein n=1 Tax=Arthrobacter sp. HY1533 TaxID=2970919 RepID=UPI0022B9F958|nr:hypothetical protein [Arthrobacter sp. HY1533]